MSKIKVYLAGGMRSDWQERVIEELGTGRFHFINPKDNHTKIATEFVVWDLLGVKMCDVVFAYLEEGNPSGLGMATEIGYGLGLGKTVIFVNEKSDNKYTVFLDISSSVIYRSFYDGIMYLDSIGNLIK